MSTTTFAIRVGLLGRGLRFATTAVVVVVVVVGILTLRPGVSRLTFTSAARRTVTTRTFTTRVVTTRIVAVVTVTTFTAVRHERNLVSHVCDWTGR